MATFNLDQIMMKAKVESLYDLIFGILYQQLQAFAFVVANQPFLIGSLSIITTE